MKSKNKNKSKFFHFITRAKCKHDKINRIIFVSVFIAVWGYWINYAVQEYKDYIFNPVFANTQLVVRAENSEVTESKKVYAYNEQVPVEVIREEIIKVSKQLGVDSDLMLRIARCESGFNNLVLNRQGSSALGTYQFIEGTWRETPSFQVFRRARTDYKHAVWEAVRMVSAGEIWRWNASRACWQKN